MYFYNILYKNKKQKLAKANIIEYMKNVLLILSGYMNERIDQNIR